MINIIYSVVLYTVMPEKEELIRKKIAEMGNTTDANMLNGTYHAHAHIYTCTGMCSLKNRSNNESYILHLGLILSQRG